MSFLTLIEQNPIETIIVGLILILTISNLLSAIIISLFKKVFSKKEYYSPRQEMSGLTSSKAIVDREPSLGATPFSPPVEANPKPKEEYVDLR